jgi:hypothetical protein
MHCMSYNVHPGAMAVMAIFPWPLNMAILAQSHVYLWPRVTTLGQWSPNAWPWLLTQCDPQLGWAGSGSTQAGLGWVMGQRPNPAQHYTCLSVDHTWVLPVCLVGHSWSISGTLRLHTCSIPVLSLDHTRLLFGCLVWHTWYLSGLLLLNTCSVPLASVNHTWFLSGCMVEHSWYISRILRLHTCSVPVLSLDHTRLLFGCLVGHNWYAMGALLLHTCSVPVVCIIPGFYLDARCSIPGGYLEPQSILSHILLPY